MKIYKNATFLLTALIAILAISSNLSCKEKTRNSPKDAANESFPVESQKDADEDFVVSEDGVVFSKDGKTLVLYPVFKNNATNYVVPDGVTTIGEGALGGSSLTSITIPNSVTTIGAGAFSSCFSLTSITVPDSVTTIEEFVFMGCRSLSSITLPNNLTTIGKCAFKDCSSLMSIVLPKSVSSIGDGAFMSCPALTAIGVDVGNASFSSVDGILFADNGKTLVAYPEGKKSAEYVIPADVTTIREEAFAFCFSLTSFEVDAGNSSFFSVDGVLFTGNGKTLVAFPKGKKVTSYDIPGDVVTIGGEAFSNCSSLTSIAIPKGVSTIGKYAFSNCSSLTSIAIPDGVTSIGEGAFFGCSSLTSIAVPNGVTSIEKVTFVSCSSLTTVLIPDTVTTIGEGAFSDCSSLTTVVVPDSVTTIEGNLILWSDSLTLRASRGAYAERYVRSYAEQYKEAMGLDSAEPIETGLKFEPIE